MTVETVTLGCRLNFAESEAMKSLLATDRERVIVNSCAVTAEAVRQTRQAIRRARRERPFAEIVATGCAVQLEPEAFRAMPEVDRIQLRDFARPTVAAGFMSRVRSFVAIRPAATTAAPFAPFGPRAGRAIRSRSKRSATRLRARSTAARRKLC